MAGRGTMLGARSRGGRGGEGRQPSVASALAHTPPRACPRPLARWLAFCLRLPPPPHTHSLPAALLTACPCPLHRPRHAAHSMPGFTGEVGKGQVDYVTIAMDGSNTPWVAYQDLAVGGKVTVRRFNDASYTWDLVGPQGFSASQARFVNLAFDSASVPYVAYQARSRAGGRGRDEQRVWAGASQGAHRRQSAHKPPPPRPRALPPPTPLPAGWRPSQPRRGQVL